jgi:Sulfotransferase domain
MLPNLIIIGAQKSGTTSLHDYLGRHPQIGMSRTKELKFFIVEGNWHKGVAWYESQCASSRPVRGEASPQYTYFPTFAGVPQRMHATVPDAKLIYLLRHPIGRIISQYVHEVDSGQEQRTLTEALREFDSNPYVLRSLYGMQLEQYLPLFPLRKILILTQEQLLQQRQATMTKAFRFLGVDDTFQSSWWQRQRHGSRDKRRKNLVGRRLAAWIRQTGLREFSPPFASMVERWACYPFSEAIVRPALDEAVLGRLAACLQPDVARLTELTGQTFPEWEWP